MNHDRLTNLTVYSHPDIGRALVMLQEHLLRVEEKLDRLLAAAQPEPEPEPARSSTPDIMDAIRSVAGRST